MLDLFDRLRSKEESLVNTQLAHRHACAGHIKARQCHNAAMAANYKNEMLIYARRCEELDREIVTLRCELIEARAALEAAQRCMA